MKQFFKSLLFLSALLIVNCQKQKDFIVAQTYEEPQDPAPSKDENWKAVPKGLQASVTSTNIRFCKK